MNDLKLDSFNLDDVYRVNSRHTHEHALQVIFLMGYEYAKTETEQLQQKYDALNAKFNINQPNEEPSIEMKRELVNQAVGMGKCFVVGDGYEQRS